jgi:tagatose 6-phosphate kinase
MVDVTGGQGAQRLVGVALNAAIDKTVAVDRLDRGAIHRPEILAALPGGKAVNVVRAATRLGLPASVVAVVGGHAGAWFEEQLASRGIPARLVQVPGETRTCLSVLDRATNQLTELYEPGVDLPAGAWVELEAALVAALGNPDALVVLAGSLPPGTPDDAYGRLATLAARSGAHVVIDVPGAPLAHALGAEPWLVKVNAREAAETTGIATDELMGVLGAADRLRDRGARQVLITRGVEGAVLVADRTWILGPPPELGLYTVGSGDAFLAGFAFSLARGDSRPDALRFGGAAAAANALAPGQGELDPADVERLLPDCIVNPRV